MKYLTILFDFDGTIADTADLSIDIINSIAPEFGIVPVRAEEVPVLKKMSAYKLLTERSGIPLWNIVKIRRLERRVREEFARRADNIRLFEAVVPLVRTLRAAGYEIGIVTSNAHAVVVGALERADVEVDFVHAGSKFFGKARAIRAALREYELNRRSTVYVGDELRDVEACKKVGIDCIAVGWGFNAPEALEKAGVKVAATPQQLLGMLTDSS